MPGKTNLHDYPAQFLEMGLRLVGAGQAVEARALVRNALAARSGDRLIAALAAQILRHKVPSFHHGMLRDTARNTAWRTAIEALAPGRRVLDIGTGSGLLALIAARAGAAHVHACEMNPLIALTAREIVLANGLGDKITIHPVHSGQLDRVRDLGGGVDLVVSEILAHDLLGENVLKTLAHAHAELCAPGAVFLPERAAIRVALADDPLRPEPLGMFEGFDLSAFNAHVKAGQTARTTDPQFILRSAAADLLSFDFSRPPELEGRGAVSLTSTGGLVSGIAQWLQVDLGGGASYENAPGFDPDAHWGVGHYALPTPRETVPGETVQVGGWHGADRIAIWAEP
jgi:SAM-dependent methyltransferase